MRIIITADPFIPVPPLNYGGIERIIYFLTEELIKNGHQVMLVAHHDSKTSAELLPYPVGKTAYLKDLKHLYNLNQLKSWKPDIIHSFSRLAYLLPYLPTTIPKLMSYQREPTIGQIKKAVKFSKKNTLAFTGCSNYISQQIAPYAPAYTVYNGVDLSSYNFKEKIEEDAPLVFLGRIEPIKGTHSAIKIALETQRKLVIAGNIPAEYQGYFDQQVKPYLNENISYIGPVNDQQKNELLGKAATLLMPIEWNEPFGIVMIEAMACGTPVIGVPKGSLPEVIIQGQNGYLANSFEELCNYVSRLPELSRATVRQITEERFSSQKIVADYTSLYTKLTNER